MTDLARITAIIAPEAEALGLELVRVKMMPSEAGEGGEALQVMAEDPATGQMIIDQCAALSRAISAQMDALEEAGEVLIPGSYHLEVSSPGIDRPLTRAKDFSRWAGHEAKISLADKIDGHRNLRGALIGLEADEASEDGGDDVVVIDDQRAGRIAVPLAAIHSAKLVLTDRLIAETGPVDASGADEIIADSSESAGSADSQA